MRRIITSSRVYVNKLYANCGVKILLIQVESKSKKVLKTYVNLIGMKTLRFT